MIVLGIDTALGACSAALVADRRVLASRHVAMMRGHAEALAPMVEALMRDAELRMDQIDRIGVTVGPGTFTGLRVGLSFARGLALALKIPCVGVTTTEAMAISARMAVHELSESYACAIDARRGEVYLQTFSPELTPTFGPALVSLDDALDRIAALPRDPDPVHSGNPSTVAGSAAATIVSRLAERGVQVLNSGVVDPEGIAVAIRASGLDPALHPPAPLYLRAPDAKLPGPPKPVPQKGHRR